MAAEHRRDPVERADRPADTVEAADATGPSTVDRPGPRRARVTATRETSSSPQRLRPSTSALTPAPGSLMPVPGDGPASPDSGRAGRRQHHRTPGDRSRPDAEDLVYLSGRIPRELRDELHVRAIGEGRPVVELMRDALRGYLDKPSGAARP